MVIGGAYFYDFATRGVPVLDQYCQKKVGSLFRRMMLEHTEVVVVWLCADWMFVVRFSVDHDPVKSPI